MAYRFLDHAGDLGLEVTASSLPELFSEALRGLTDSLVDVKTVSISASRSIEIEAPDLEILLVDWLNEAIVLYETEGWVFSTASVRIEQARSRWSLAGSASGEPYDSERHGLKTLVKAVTLHNLSLEQRPSGWHARVILDL